MPDLEQVLTRLDGRPYPAYRDLAGSTFVAGPYRLHFEHIQGDPFAAPSRLRIDVPATVPDLPPAVSASADARRAGADYLHRRILGALRATPRPSGLDIAALGPEVLDRTAVMLAADGSIVLRLTAGLPAAGRRILGRTAATLLCAVLPAALDAALRPPDLDVAALRVQVEAVLDQVALRAALAANGLVAFLADGSILPRRSGVDTGPLPQAVPLEAPASLAVTLVAPHAGTLRGLGVRRGVTLVVGGGYHGKSTLLDALAQGVYDHVPGDGRERCVTLANAVAVRAEDGRAVRGVDLRPFIGPLPLGRSTLQFDTDDASGSTSQAAAIIEALEAGATLLLVDEDTAATNFMIRDARMRRLVAPASEPITPFIDRVRQLATERAVSSVLVVGGAGDYLDVADTVIQMADYRPRDVTAEARLVADALPLGEAAPRAPGPWPVAAARVPVPDSLDPQHGRRARVRAVRTRAIEFGPEEIDVSLLGQLVDAGQCRMIGDALLALSRGLADGRRDVPALLDALEDRLAAGGLEAVTAPGFGDRARARRFEIAAALSRLRALRLT